MIKKAALIRWAALNIKIAFAPNAALAREDMCVIIKKFIDERQREKYHSKLGDFGVARTLEKTSSGLSKKGTCTYMAPEVYKGERYGSDVDIYSLDIVKAVKVDVSSFDTSKVTNMEYMFGYCYNLKEVDVSGFDVSSLQSADGMFYGVPISDSIDKSKFNNAE